MHAPVSLSLGCIPSKKHRLILLVDFIVLDRADNIKLYEKIKFLQSYGGANKGGADDTVKR